MAKAFKAIDNFSLHSQRGTQLERPKQMPENDRRFCHTTLPPSDIPWLLNTIPFPRARLSTLDKVSVRSSDPGEKKKQFYPGHLQ